MMHYKPLIVAVVVLLGSLGLAKVETTDAILEKFGDDVVLGCKTEDIPHQPWEWKKDGKKLVPTPEEPKYVLSNENGTLKVMDVMPEDVGEYECIVELHNEESFNKTVHLYSSAFVSPFEKSKNLVQGDPLVLDCEVSGHPTPAVQWFKDEKPMDASDERVSLRPNEDGVENATLRVENLDFDDRADYVCFAENKYGSHNSTILVRVKDKLAALWPFLGICAEVAILVVIIFIYERKRAKKLEEMEAKEEADHLTNSHAHKGGDDVRQRK